MHQIEEISLKAWPALETIHYDGWELRFSGGLTKRSNSVNISGKSSLDFRAKIEYCENLYRLKKLPVCFKITQIAECYELEKMLVSREYNHEFDISVQLLSLNDFTFKPDNRIVITNEAEDNWIDSCATMFEMNPNHHMILKQIIDKINLPKCIISIMKDKEIVGCGMGVLDEKYLGLFDIVIHKNYRNHGLGRIMVENILYWGKKNGAEIAYLQVLIDNDAANSLYCRLGFKEAYKYFYLVKN